MFTERLTNLRLATGRSQEAVAQDLHMTRSAYSSYETGRRTPPPEVLLLLARYFQTTTDYLLGGTDESGLPPVLDARGRAVIRLYQENDERGRDMIYRIALQEKIQYGSRQDQTEDDSPEA